MWQHFDFDANGNKSVCTLKKAVVEVCGKEIKGKFPTKFHLHTVHPMEHAALLKKEAEKTAKSEREAERRAALLKVSHQLTLAESLKSGTYYTQSSLQYQAISRKLATFIGCTNVPSSIVENIEFCDFVHTLDRCYSVPGRVCIGKELQKLLIELKAKIGSFLEEANKISICADIWSKKGLSSSYIGITAHFYSKKDHRRHCVTLAAHLSGKKLVKECPTHWSSTFLMIDRMLCVIQWPKYFRNYSGTISFPVNGDAYKPYEIYHDHLLYSQHLYRGKTLQLPLVSHQQ